MYYSNVFRRRDKYFLIFLLVGFLIKYNYLNLKIFNIPVFGSLFFRNLVILLVFSLIAKYLIKGQKAYVITFIAYTIFLIFFLANLWYNRYFGNYLSLADITMGQGVRPFKVLIRQLFLLKDILFIFEMPILIYLTFLKKDKTLFKSSKYKFSNSRKFKLKYKFGIAILIIILLASQLIYANYIFEDKNIMELYQESTPAFVGVYGITPLYLAEFNYLYFNNNVKEEKEEEIEVKSDTKLNGEYSIDNPKNIIVIQLESFDEKIIDYKHNGKEITPFLNDLKDESLYFENFYAQHINGSFDAEFSFLTSLYPINKNYAFKENDMEEFNSMVKVLDKKGYNSIAFHGNKEEFFYRDKGYLEMGFDKFYSRKDFSAQEGKIKDDTYFGINDYDFFDQSIEYLKDAEKPFFAFFITVSSHTPFDFYPEKEKVEEFEDISTTLVRDYFQSMAFVDKSLKMFFEKLKNNDLYKDTLFVIYSDHTADVNKEEYESGGNFSIDRNIKEPENVPLLINHSDIEGEVIDRTGTHTDLGPTIIDLIGQEEKPSEFLGDSLLNKEERPVVFLHETPQILYKNQLFLQIPSEIDKENNFKKFSHKKGSKKEDVELKESDKEKIKEIITYMQEIMKEK